MMIDSHIKLPANYIDCYWLLFCFRSVINENHWKVTESYLIDCSSISSINQLIPEVALTPKTCVFYAENNFHMQFADKTAFLIRSWVGFEVEVADALILTEHNKTVIALKNRPPYELGYSTASKLHASQCTQVHSEDNFYCYQVTANNKLSD